MSSIIKVLFLISLCSFITNCSLWSKGEEEKEAEIARFKDYYPSDVYTDIAKEGDEARKTASYEDDDYSAADDDPADSQDDEQSAYLDKALDEDNSESDFATEENLPVEKSVQATAAQAIAPKQVSAAKFKNRMYKFSNNCEMRSKASGDSKNVGTVSAGKKLWVENHNSGWVKVYKKSGAVFINKSCL